MNFLAHWNYIIVIIMMMAGFYVVISSTNLIKKLIGLGTFQTAVFIFYISLGKVKGYLCLRVRQQNIDSIRVTALPLAVIRGKARQRGGSYQFLKGGGVGLHQKLGGGHFLPAEGIPES